MVAAPAARPASRRYRSTGHTSRPRSSRLRSTVRTSTTI